MLNKCIEKSNKKQCGFTLIELMIAIVIVGILSAIAFPSYTSYVLRGKRGEGRAFLMEAAALQERYYSDCNKYGDLGGANNCAANTVNIPTTSETGLYTLSATMGDANRQSFTLTATPTFADADCGNLTINQAGQRGESGTDTVDNCWGK